VTQYNGGEISISRSSPGVAFAIRFARGAGAGNVSDSGAIQVPQHQFLMTPSFPPTACQRYCVPGLQRITRRCVGMCLARGEKNAGPRIGIEPGAFVTAPSGRL